MGAERLSWRVSGFRSYSLYRSLMFSDIRSGPAWLLVGCGGKLSLVSVAEDRFTPSLSYVGQGQ